MATAPHTRPKNQAAAAREATRRTMHSCGLLLVLLTAVILVWDAIGLIDGRGFATFSGLADIWTSFDKATFISFEAAVTSALGHPAWTLAFAPVLSAPAVIMFGLPGFALLFAYSRDISLRRPSLAETEYLNMGGDARRMRRR